MNSDQRSLPIGWSWAALHELVASEPNSITDGPFGSNLKTEHYTQYGPRVIRLHNIGDGVFVDEKAHISEERFDRLRKHEVKAGDLVVALLGERLPRSCMVPETVGKAIVKADCVRFCPNRKVVAPQYVQFWLNSAAVQREVTNRIKGVGRPRMNLSQLKQLEVAVPPRAEQRRIVAEIEKQFSRLGAGVAALRRVAANLKRYKAAVLKAACTGALTADWRAAHPDVEPASALLDRILTQRRKQWEAQHLATYEAKGKVPPKNWKDRYKEPASPDMSNLPELPEGWCWAKVEQLLIEDSCNGISVKGSNEPPGVPALRLSAMSENGFDYSDRRYIPITDSIGESLAIRCGDFFVSRGNGSLHLVGRGTLAQEPSERIVFPDTMIRLRLVTLGNLRTFLSIIWSSRFIRSQIEKKARTTAGIYKISQRDVDAFVIPLPPLIEQDAIISGVQACGSIILKLENDIGCSLMRSARLKQAILKRAFEGKLVEQDATDEPASALLERIRQESNGQRSATARKPRRKKTRNRGSPA